MTQPPAPEQSPLIDRVRRRRECALMLRHALHAVVSHRMLAAQIGVGRHRVDAWTDVESGRSIPLSDVVALPTEARQMVVSWLAESLGMALVTREDAASEGPQTLLGSVASKTGALLHELGEAYRDGSLTADEAIDLDKAAGELEAAARAVRELSRRALEQRVVPLREVKR